MNKRRQPAFVSISLLLCVLSLPIPVTAQAQDETSKQLWVNFVMGRPKSEKLYFELDIEGARQVSGGDPWKYLYGTGLMEYYPSSWIDLTGELTTGITRQSADLDSFEATARLGIRFHLISQIFNSPLVTKIRPERMSGRRVNLALLSRVERRNFWYNGDSRSSVCGMKPRIRWRMKLRWTPICST